MANGNDQFTNIRPIGNQSGEFTNVRPLNSSSGTPISDTSTLRRTSDPSGVKSALLDPFKALDVTKGIENYTEKGRAEHPVLSRVGDVTRGLKELAFGGQSAGRPMGTSSGVVDNPVTAAMSMGSAGAAKAAEKIPSVERAGGAFQEVMGAAKNIPIDVAGPGDTALRISKMAESGGSMPKVIRDFLRRATDPSKPPITYEEARDFYSNASRLSADEMNRLTPALKRQVAMFTKALNASLEDAASQAGKLSKYKGAMGEYRRAKKLESLMQTAKEWALKGAIGAGGYYAAKDALGH